MGHCLRTTSWEMGPSVVKWNTHLLTKHVARCRSEVIRHLNATCCRELANCSATPGNTRRSCGRRSAPQAEPPSTGFTRWSRAASEPPPWAPWSPPRRERESSDSSLQHGPPSDGSVSAAADSTDSAQTSVFSITASSVWNLSRSIKKNKNKNGWWKHLKFRKENPSQIWLSRGFTISNLEM